MMCPNGHEARREPNDKPKPCFPFQLYCPPCAEFFEFCALKVHPMDVCWLPKGHGNVHEDSRGHAYVLNLSGVTGLSIRGDN